MHQYISKHCIICNNNNAIILKYMKLTPPTKYHLGPNFAVIF